MPDSAAYPQSGLSLSVFLSLSLSFTLSLTDAVHPETWPHQGWSHVFSLANAIHPEGTPWNLQRLDPGRTESQNCTACSQVSAASRHRQKPPQIQLKGTLPFEHLEVDFTEMKPH